MNLRSCLFFLIFLTTTCYAQSPFIHVDQFGYQQSATKVAVLSNPLDGFNAANSYSPPAQLELRNASTNAVVFTGAPVAWNGGGTHAQSGDQGWWFDFSSVTANGSYYVHDATNNESSATFDISDYIYEDILKAAGRMYYYNRCGTAKNAANAGTNWADATSFTQDANTRYVYDKTNAALEKDLSGGWFDAGDYNKYVTFTHDVLHNLLWAYQENPNAFSDDWNIPESGNGIPDILDEVKWELDWLLKMTNPDGSVHIKMGSQNHEENHSAPPSSNTDTRYYGPTCTTASITVASVFAHAAKVFSAFDASYATTLQTNAEQAWAYVSGHLENNTLETACDDGSIVSGDADLSVADQRKDALTAAIYLFDLTGTMAYDTFIVANINDSPPMNNNNWDNYHIPAVDALLLYTSLSNADAITAGNITASVTASVTNNWSDYFGWNTLDLYRAYVPDWTYHWGSTKPKGYFGVLNNILVNYGINSGSASSYTMRAKEIVHYFHGVNPLGLVYLSNMYSYGAEKCANEIYHLWFQDGSDWDDAQTSLYGPASGYVPGGPNSSYSANTDLQPPYNQPLQKSYLDWNAGFPQNSWEITEPSITYQAPYIRLLAAFVQSTPLAVEWGDPLLAVYTKGHVELGWSTVSEENADKFEIEHSIDSRNFDTIGSVAASGNSQERRTYFFVHQLPAAGLNFYRVKQLDFDGSHTYSRVVSVNITDHTELSIFPNPADKTLHIKSPSGRYQFQITDIQGQLQHTIFSNGSSHSISISALRPGTYLVEVIDLETGHSTKRRFVKA